MKTATIVIALLATLTLFSAHNGHPTVTSSSTNTTGKPAAQLSSPGGPVSWAPFREKLIVTEEEPILTAFSVDCPSRSPTGNEFELLDPTPAFVHLSPACVATSEARALAIVQVSPQVGDAGKYQMKVRATPCYGSLGSEITFKLKVKKL